MLPYLQFMSTRNETGRLGESLAVAYLQQKDYTILHQNWRFRNKEVDIIAVKNDILHFVEVKTAKTMKFGHPEEKVTKAKLRHLIDAAEEFVYQYPEWKRVQFDVLAVTMIKGKEIEYFLIEDVYE